jgi:hypothetical protein
LRLQARYPLVERRQLPADLRVPAILFLIDHPDALGQQRSSLSIDALARWKCRRVSAAEDSIFASSRAPQRSMLASSSAQPAEARFESTSSPGSRVTGEEDPRSTKAL